MELVMATPPPCCLSSAQMNGLQSLFHRGGKATETVPCTFMFTLEAPKRTKTYLSSVTPLFLNVST